MALSTKRGPYAKTAARREEILRVALDVFGRSGYRGSSVREIAAQVGLSETGVLHHFGGKVALLEAVLGARDQADAREHGFLRAFGRDSMRSLVDHNQRRGGVVRLFTTLAAEASDPDHPAHGWFRQRYAKVRSQMAGELDAHDGPVLPSEVAAQLIVAVMDGLQVQWLLDPDVEMVPAFDAFLGLLYGELPSPTGADAGAHGRCTAPEHT
jgi:AcrR family transcriptional regulator